MIYLWESFIKAAELGINIDKSDFAMAESFSPYLELSFKELNRDWLEEGETIEVNPYVRFYSIFRNLFPPDRQEYPELRRELFTILLHAIGKNDVRMGMTLEEYYKKLLREELMAGAFGELPVKSMESFTAAEQNHLLNGIMRLYRVGENRTLFQEMAVTLFKNCIFYVKNKDPYEILIYVGMVRNRVNENKVNTIIHLFAGLNYEVNVFYAHHFGIIGIDETMHLDETVMY